MPYLTQTTKTNIISDYGVLVVSWRGRLGWRSLISATLDWTTEADRPDSLQESQLSRAREI